MPASLANLETMLSNNTIENSSNPKQIKLLLVEDDKINQMLGKKLLVNAGYCVDVASDGLIAVELLKLNIYDVIITDIKIPNMDGYELTQYIRSSNEWFKTIPIIAISAYPSSVEKQKALEAGINDFVSKPFILSELVAALTPFIP